MAYRSSYLKEIEGYFLSLMGKGIMLSSRDYDLILNWKKREIPKGVVLKGIRRAFQLDRVEKEKNDRVLNLSRVASYVEEEIGRYRAMIGDEFTEETDSEQKIIKKIVERVNGIIKFEKEENARKHYLNARDKFMQLLHSKRDNIYKAIEEIEEDFYNDFFEALPKTEQDKINKEAEMEISKRVRLMTEKARRESIVSFRNEKLKKKYRLASIVGED